MRPLSGKQKTLVVIGILLAPFVAVHIQEMIFRHRVERLLADIRGLQLRRANLTEIRTVFNRWDPHGQPCDEHGCSLEGDVWGLGFADISLVNPEDAVSDWHLLWLLPLLRTFGGRIAHVEAGARAEGGVRMISFMLELETSVAPEVNGFRFYPGVKTMSGGAISGAWFSVQDDWDGLMLHPNYVIGGLGPHAWRRPSWWGMSVYVAFDPHVDPMEVTRLMSFDFTCLTRWAPCREPGELMPEAAAQYSREEFQLARARKAHVCGPNIIGLMARDARYAGVVEVAGNTNERPLDDRSMFLPAVRLIENLKPVSDWKVGEVSNLEIFDVNTDRVVTDSFPEIYPGRRFIVLAQSEKGHPVRADRCGIVPLNPENLELVKQAIAGNGPPQSPRPLCGLPQM